jgi:hypothetical protein
MGDGSCRDWRLCVKSVKLPDAIDVSLGRVGLLGVVSNSVQWAQGEAYKLRERWRRDGTSLFVGSV